MQFAKTSKKRPHSESISVCCLQGRTYTTDGVVTMTCPTFSPLKCLKWNFKIVVYCWRLKSKMCFAFYTMELNSAKPSIQLNQSQYTEFMLLKLWYEVRQTASFDQSVLVQWRNLFVPGTMLTKRIAVILKILAFCCNGKETINYNQLPQDLRINRCIIIWKHFFSGDRRVFHISYYYFNSKPLDNDYLLFIIIARFIHLYSVYWFTFIELEFHQCRPSVVDFSFGIQVAPFIKKFGAKIFEKRNNSQTTNVHYALYHFTMMRI